jgi:hypothetical protein
LTVRYHTKVGWATGVFVGRQLGDGGVGWVGGGWLACRFRGAGTAYSLSSIDELVTTRSKTLECRKTMS